MPIIIILIGLILMMTAWSGTYAQLATELESDIPAYFKWGIALGAVVALGYIPGMKQPSRWLLGLIVVVIIVSNSNKLFSSIQSFMQSSGQPTPLPAAPGPTAAQSAASAANSATQVASDLSVLTTLAG